ncbi:aminoglycoside 6'-N-acetyltransferase [Devosia sp. SL43]|uniref:aminoglycoside 6'-N-acetyltransferase n=1 Tax=Devosia sp. SL43 TaxID=2806348 RepID=UPI001F000323|nr:aminoglycoside 6'-N-acetyltransferase [Devosia sp. SL43]UJW85042.1 GNAT family N-acetyltransferase [Devosia sp. SL43]
MITVTVTVATTEDADDWAAMRQALWPNGGLDAHRADIEAWLANPRDLTNLIARSDTGQALGFAEASLRHDYVNGTKSTPVAFLEGIYVDPAARRSGVARQLVEAVERWGRQRGCSEFASDADIANVTSHQMHGALGFTETQRVVYFRKLLG